MSLVSLVRSGSIAQSLSGCGRVGFLDLGWSPANHTPQVTMFSSNACSSPTKATIGMTEYSSDPFFGTAASSVVSNDSDSDPSAGLSRWDRPAITGRTNTVFSSSSAFDTVANSRSHTSVLGISGLDISKHPEKRSEDDSDETGNPGKLYTSTSIRRFLFPGGAHSSAGDSHVQDRSEDGLSTSTGSPGRSAASSPRASLFRWAPEGESPSITSAMNPSAWLTSMRSSIFSKRSQSPSAHSPFLTPSPDMTAISNRLARHKETGDVAASVDSEGSESIVRSDEFESITGSSPLLFPYENSWAASIQPQPSPIAPSLQAPTASGYTGTVDKVSRLERFYRRVKSLLSTAQSIASRYPKRGRDKKEQIICGGSGDIGSIKAGTRGFEGLDMMADQEIDDWTEGTTKSLNNIGRRESNLVIRSDGSMRSLTLA